MEIELESFVITIVFTCVPQTLIHPLAHCRWRKQRGSRNNCKKLVFHRCETYLNFVIHQLESSQLCPNLVLHTLIQPLKIADRRYFAKTFTTIFSCASFPNPGLLGQRVIGKCVSIVTCFGRGRFMCEKDWRKKPQRFGKQFGASNW